MTRHKMLSISTVIVCSLLALGIALGPAAHTHADTMPSLFNDMVFAHDMENAWIHGTTGRYNIVGVHGTPTAELFIGAGTQQFSFTDEPSPLSFSRQHLKTPPLIKNVSPWDPAGYFDTKTWLLSPTSELSFSVFYNLDPAAAQHTSAKRFLTTYSSSNALANEFLFDALNSTTQNHTVRFWTNWINSSNTNILQWPGAVTRDGTWRHIGFVFNGGSVQLYVNGQPFDDPKDLVNTPTIVAQNKTWRLLEEGLHNEFFMNSSYDEAGLWYRALSDAEMLFLYRNGLAAIPEPSTLLLLAMAGLAFACASGRRRK